MEKAKEIIEYVRDYLVMNSSCYLIEEALNENECTGRMFHRYPLEYAELGDLYQKVRDMVNVRVMKGISGGGINAQLGLKILGEYFEGGKEKDDGLSGMSEEEMDERIKELWGVVYGK